MKSIEKITEDHFIGVIPIMRSKINELVDAVNSQSKKIDFISSRAKKALKMKK